MKVFVGDTAFSSRFLQTSIVEEQEQQKSKELQPIINVLKKNNLVIEEFRKSWNSEDSAWAEILDDCTLGGNRQEHLIFHIFKLKAKNKKKILIEHSIYLSMIYNLNIVIQ